MSLQEPQEDGNPILNNTSVQVPSTWPALGFSRDDEPARSSPVAATPPAAPAARRTTGSSSNFITRALSEALRTSEGERLALQEQVHELRSHLQDVGRGSQESSAVDASSSSADTEAPSNNLTPQGGSEMVYCGLPVASQVRLLRLMTSLAGHAHPDQLEVVDQLSDVANTLEEQPASEPTPTTQLEDRLNQLLDRLQPAVAPPLPRSPERAARAAAGGTPPTSADSPPSSPQSTARGHAVQIPPTPASARSAGAAGGPRVLREQLYSPDEESPSGAKGGNSLRLWGQSAEADEENVDLPEGTPVPGVDGAPVPAFAYGKGGAPYPSRPSHPLHKHSHDQRPAKGGVKDVEAAGDSDDGGDADGALLQALAGEGGSAASPEAKEPGAQPNSGASTTAVPSPFVSHTSTRRLSPQKRSKFAAKASTGPLSQR